MKKHAHAYCIHRIKENQLDDDSKGIQLKELTATSCYYMEFDKDDLILVKQ